MAINSGYLAWLKEEERKKKNPTFKEQSKQDRIIYTDPSFESTSKEKSTKWETKLLSGLPIKQYGRSYNEKLGNYLNQQGLDPSEHDDFRKWMDSQEKGVQTTGQKTEGIWNWLNSKDKLDKERRVREANGQEFQRDWVSEPTANNNKKESFINKGLEFLTPEKSGKEKSFKDKGAFGKAKDLGVFDFILNMATDSAFKTGGDDKVSKEVRRGAERLGNTASMSLLDNITTDKYDTFRSDNRSGFGKAADVGYDLAGALLPGAAASNAIRGTKAGAKLIPQSGQLGKNILRRTGEGALIGGAYSLGELANREGFNGDQYTAKDNLTNFGKDMALGAVLDNTLGPIAEKILAAAGKGISVEQIARDVEMDETQVREIIRGTLEGQEIVGARSGKSLPPPVNAMRNPFLEGPLAPQSPRQLSGETLGIEAPNLYTQRFNPSEEVQIDGTPLLGDGSVPPPPPQNPNDFLLPSGPIKQFDKTVYKSGNRYDVALADGSKLSFKANGDMVNVNDAVIRRGNDIEREVDANELLGMDLGERLAPEELERALKGLPFAKTTKEEVDGELQQQMYDYLGKNAPVDEAPAPQRIEANDVRTAETETLAQKLKAQPKSSMSEVDLQYRDMKAKLATSGKNTPEHRVKLLKEMRAFADEHNLDFSEANVKRLNDYERESQLKKQAKADEKRLKAEKEAEQEAWRKKYEEEQRAKAEDVDPGDQHIYDNLSKNKIFNKANAKDKKSVINLVKRKAKNWNLDKNKLALTLEDDSPMFYDVFSFPKEMKDADIHKRLQENQFNGDERAEGTKAEVLILNKEDLEAKQVTSPKDEFDEYDDFGDGEGVDSGINIFDLGNSKPSKPKKAIDDLAPKKKDIDQDFVAKTEPVVNDLVSNKVNDVRKERVQKAIDDGDYKYLELHRDRIRKDPELNELVNKQGNPSSVPNYDGELKALLKQHYAGKLKNKEFTDKSNLLTVLQAIDNGDVDFFKNTKWVYTNPKYTQIAADKLGVDLKSYGGAEGVRDYIHKTKDWKDAAKKGDEIADLFSAKFAEKIKPSVKFVPHSGDPQKKNLIHRIEINGKLTDAMRKELKDNGYSEWDGWYGHDQFKHAFNGENTKFGEAFAKGKTTQKTETSNKVKETKREYSLPSSKEMGDSVKETNKKRILKGLEEDPAKLLNKSKWIFTEKDYLDVVADKTGVDLEPFGGAQGIVDDVTSAPSTAKRAEEIAQQITDLMNRKSKVDMSDPTHMKKAIDEATEIESQMKKMMDDNKKDLQETLDKFNRQYAEWDAVQGMRVEAKKIQSDVGKIYIPEENRADWFDAVPRRFRAAKTAKDNMDIFKAAEDQGYDSVDEFVSHLQKLDEAFRSKKTDFVDSTFTNFDADGWQRLIDKSDESVKSHTKYQELDQKLETVLDRIRNPIAPPKEKVAPAPVEKPKTALEDLEAPLQFKKQLLKSNRKGQDAKPMRFAKEVVSRKDPLSFVAKNERPKTDKFNGEWSTKQVDTPSGDTLRMETRKGPVLEDLIFKKPVKKNGPERYKKQVREGLPSKKTIKKEFARKDIIEVDNTNKKDTPPPKQEKRNRSSDPLGVVAGSIDPNVGRPISGKPSLKQRIKEGKFTLQTVGQKFKTDFVSDVQFAKDLERDIIKMDTKSILGTLPDGSAKVKDSLYKGLREVRRSTSKAIRWIEDGYVPIFKSLNKGNIRQAEFEDYILAKHADDILRNNKDKVDRATLINQRLDEIQAEFDISKKKRQKQDPNLKEEKKALLQEIDSLKEYILPKEADANWVESKLKQWENDDVMKKAQENFVKEQQKDLDLLVAAGVYTKEAADNMKKAHPNYISMVRDKGDADPIFGASSNISKPNPHLKRRGLGSEEKIQSPVESAVRNRMISVLNADRNRAMQKIGKMAQVDGSDKYFRRVSASEDVSKLNTVKFYENGKEVRYEVPQTLKDAFENLSRQKAESVVEQTIKKVGNVIRKGSTHYNIDFIVKSLLRESTGQQAILQSRTGAGLKDMAFGTLDSFFGPQLQKATGGKFKSYRADFEKMGGSMTGLISQDSQTQKLAERALERGTLGKGWHVINPFKNIERLGEKVEFGPKLGEFRSAKKKGYSDEDAMYEAVDVIDYSDSGKFVRDGVLSTVPYMNAAIRGNTRLIQAAKEHPGKFLGKGLMYITLPTLTMYGARFAPYVTDEQREKLNNMSQWQRNVFWHVPGPDGDIYAIPKAHVVAQVFANPVERALDYMLESQDKNVSENIQDTLKDLFTSLAPPSGIPVYTQLIETLTNHQLFLDRPIEDMEMERKNPEDRYNYYTSEMAKKLGKKSTTSEAFSTADIDHLLKGTTGGVGRDTLDVWDNLVSKTGSRPSKVKSIGRILNPLDQFKYDSTGSTEIYNRLYAKKTAEERAGVKESAAMDYYEQMHDLNKEIKEIREDTKMSSKEKEKKVTEIRNRQRSIGQEVLDEDVLKKKKAK